MSFSQGKSSGSSTTTSPYAGTLAKFGIQDLKAAEPVMQQLLGQEGEALRTGGITNQIPIINRQVDAARQASSQSAQSTQQMLSKYGLANSAFGAGIMANQNQIANQEVANVPANEVERILGQAPGVVGEATSAGANLLGTAANFNNTTKTSSTDSSFGGQWPSVFALTGALPSGGGGASGGGSSGNPNAPSTDISNLMQELALAGALG